MSSSMIARFTSRTLEGVAVRIDGGVNCRVTLLTIGAAECICSSLFSFNRGWSCPYKLTDQNSHRCPRKVDEDISNGGIAIGKERLQILAATTYNQPEREYADDFTPWIDYRAVKQNTQNSEESDVQPFVR